jgi:carboxyl-terminal processing protease
MEIDREKRERILQKVCRLIENKYFDPEFDILKWRALVETRRRAILEPTDSRDFERQMHDFVPQLGSSHTAFFHRDFRPLPPRQSICATLQQCETEHGRWWMVQDIQEGGPAHEAGIRQGDLLVGIEGESIRPPDRVLLRPGGIAKLQVRRADGSESSIQVGVPMLKSKRPFSMPKPVISSVLDGNIGYLKVNMFPGIIGIEVARDIDAAVASFRDCDRLIVDLRGNSGGGIGGLRLMSYLTPDKRPIGYSLSRSRAQKGYRKEDLTRFQRIPSRKIELLWLVLRYGFADHSIALFTEGLGRRRFHGSISMLVNEHSASASEMVAAFASENRLAKIVGTPTPGRLVGSKPFKVSDGYYLILPVGGYLTWQGARLEGKGVQPDIEVPLSYDAICQGHDNQLEAAIECLGTKSAASLDVRTKTQPHEVNPLRL